MTRLIVIEGTDCSGKSTIAKTIAHNIGYLHQHEPTFSSEEADQLNFRGMDVWQREFHFMLDRIRHQEILNSQNVCLDRYILSGLAYADYFSPEVLPMMKSIYSMKRHFKRPTINVFVDVKPEFALQLNEKRKGTIEFNPKLTLETLQKLRESFFVHMRTMRHWGVETFAVPLVENDLGGTIHNVEEVVRPFVEE